MSDDETDLDFDQDCVIKELGTLISQIQQINEHHRNTIQTLENISQRIQSHNNITIKVDGNYKEFDEVLEELHLDSLEKIKITGKSNFGDQLLGLLRSQS